MEYSKRAERKEAERFKEFDATRGTITIKFDEEAVCVNITSATSDAAFMLLSLDGVFDEIREKLYREVLREYLSNMLDDAK